MTLRKTGMVIWPRIKIDLKNRLCLKKHNGCKFGCKLTKK